MADHLNHNILFHNTLQIHPQYKYYAYIIHMNHNYLLEFQQEEAETTPKHTPNTVYITELNTINKGQMHSPKSIKIVTDNSRKSIPHRTPSYQPQVASKAWLFLLIRGHKTKGQEEFSKKSHLLNTEKYAMFSYIKETKFDDQLPALLDMVDSVVRVSLRSKN